MAKTKVPVTRKKKQTSKAPTSMNASREAVQRAVEVMIGMGWTREFALEMLATQLHESLLSLRAYHAKKGGK